MIKNKVAAAALSAAGVMVLTGAMVIAGQDSSTTTTQGNSNMSGQNGNMSGNMNMGEQNSNMNMSGNMNMGKKKSGKSMSGDNMSGGNMSGQMNGGMSGNMSRGAMRADAKFVMEAAMGGMAEVEAGRLALQRSSSDAVKQFAQQMIDDHTKANEELMQLASSKGMTPPTTLDAKHMAMMAKMQTLSGAEFDRAYIKQSGVKDHEKNAKVHERESTRGTDADLKAYAAKTLPIVQAHLQMARDMATSMKSMKMGGNMSGGNMSGNMNTGSMNGNMSGNMNGGNMNMGGKKSKDKRNMNGNMNANMGNGNMNGNSNMSNSNR
ncbi:MAG: DUF4142 domain-containing protein [Pyrinomonadaceae bacterium]